MLDIVTILEDLRRVGAEFLIADLGTAITFIAGTRLRPTIRFRNLLRKAA